VDPNFGLGGNRWQNDFQANFAQGFLKMAQVTRTLSQDATFALTHGLVMPCHRRCTSNAFVAIGYAGRFGREQKLDGKCVGTKNREDQLRLTCWQFVTPTWQILISAGHDVSVSGQLKQDFRITLRIAKLF
jgi:hypothetical protein